MIKVNLNYLNEKVSKIEETQRLILNELSEMRKTLNENSNVLIGYLGTYKDKKMRDLRNTMVDGNFKTSQMDSLSEIVSMFKEVIEDKENLEKELELLKEK